MIETRGKTFIIDTGPDFRQQMLREKVKKIDGVVFTHEHKDHIAGLDDVRAFNFILGKHIDVYASVNVQNKLMEEFSYIFAKDKYPGVPLINVHHIENKPFSIDGVEFIPIEVMHYKMPVLGFRVGDFTYITDAKTISNKEKKKIKGTKILVLNALRKTKHISHLNLEQALDLVAELNPQTCYLTHLSHLMGKHEEVEKELPANVRLGFDGLRIDVL